MYIDIIIFVIFASAVIISPQQSRFICAVTTVGAVESSSVMISWIGPQENITNNNKVTITPTVSSGNAYSSSLQFNNLNKIDEGTYTCNVMIVDTNRSQSVEIQSFTSKLS